MHPLKAFPTTLILVLLVFLPARAVCQFLPGDSAPRAAAGNQSSAQIASSGNGYLIVWADTRSVLASPFLGTGGPYSGTGLGTMTDIYAARLDSSGKLLDSIPIVVTQSMYNQITPLVAWNGQNYLVVWMTERADNRYYFDVVAARVTPGGAVLDNPPLLLKSAATSNDNYTPWSVTSDGTNWAVAFRNLDTTTNIYTIDGLRIAPDGTILDAGGKRLREDFWNSGATNATLAFAGNEYLLTWLELSFTTGTWIVKGQLLSTTLDPIGTVFAVDLLNITSPQFPSSASDGNGFLVTWFENRYYGFAQIYGTRVSHAGQVLDQTGIAITAPAGYTQFAPDVTWDGHNYIVSYNKQSTGFNDDIFVTRVSNTGTVLDSGGILVKGGSANQGQPSIAPGPLGGSQVVWTDLQAAGPYPQDIGTAFVSASGTVGASSVASQGSPRQRSPRMAAGAGEFLTVFRSEISGESRILAQRVDATGNALDLEPILLAGGTPAAASPAVAFNGSVFLAVWEDSGNIYGRRLRPDGVVLDGSALLIMQGNRPDVSALGDTFLIVADAAPVNPQYRFIFSARLASTGGVLGGPVQVSGNFAVSPRVTALGSRWLVVWENHPTHDDPTSIIQGAFVNPDGSPWGVFLVSNGLYDATPAVAGSGTSGLIAWANADIFGRRILSDGTLLDTASGIVISNAPGSQFEPAIAWDGSEFLLDWLDQRNDPYPNQVRGDIYGARVDVNGNVLDPSGLAIANSPSPEEDPTVVAGNGTAFFAYATFQNAGYAAFRIALRQFPLSTTTCFYTLSPAGASLSVAGGSGTFNVQTTNGCAWSVASNVAWISVTSPLSGTGSATVSYSVLANTDTAPRSGTISAAGQIFTVSQAGIACSYSITPTSQTISAAGGSGTVTVNASAGCTWSASSNAAWITITSASSGSGNGAITYSVLANNSTASRTGSITVAGQLFTVSQPPLLFSTFGRVVSSRGTALARVTMTFAIVSGNGPVPAPVQTDSNGAWQQTGFQSGTTYSVTPSKSPYTFTPSSRTFTDGSTALNFVGSK